MPLNCFISALFLTLFMHSLCSASDISILCSLSHSFHALSLLSRRHIYTLLSFSLFSCTLFAQPQTFRYSIFLGWAGGPWGRDPFNTLDLSSGTLFLSVSGIHLHSLLLSRNEKPRLFCILICCFLSSHPFHVKFCFIQMSVLFPQVYHSAQSQSDYLFASLVTLFQIHNKEDAK